MSLNRAGAWLSRRADLALAVAVVAVVGMMIVPLPTALLDVLIAANLAIAAVLLVISLQVASPLRIATFPSLLLLTTLFRLGLEISATRLVLLRADAGEVIHAFGRFVVGGSLIVGLVIFLILTLVQYLVISKGAERVAEVAARFALDAMPGKQMAIDADLRAGHVDAAGARIRRARLAREARLFGAMDGAMKFVRGDAVAGLVIVGVNLLGGLAVGLLQHDLSFDHALKTYAVLTVGGGLVAQIPALVISLAAGIVITRVASEDEREDERQDERGDNLLDPSSSGGQDTSRLGRELAAQIGEHPGALAVASALLLVLSLTPGMPTWPFLLLAAVGGAGAWAMYRRSSRAAAVAGPKPTSMDYVVLSPVVVELGPALMRLGDSATGMERWSAGLRDEITGRMGMRVLDLRVAALLAPPADNAFVLRVGESIVLRGTLAPSTGIGGDAVLVRSLVSRVQSRAADWIGLQDTSTWLGGWERTHPTLVREVVPKRLSLPELVNVLRGVVGEGLSLRHGQSILESLAQLAPGNGSVPLDRERLLNAVRTALGRTIVESHLDADGNLSAWELDTQIEDVLRESVHGFADGRRLVLEPRLAQDIVTAFGKVYGAIDAPNLAVVLTSPELRPHLRGLLLPTYPDATVLSYAELPPEVPVQYLGRVRIGAAA